MADPEAKLPIQLEEQKFQAWAPSLERESLPESQACWRAELKVQFQGQVLAFHPHSLAQAVRPLPGSGRDGIRGHMARVGPALNCKPGVA